jgi:hypothetical protein
MNVDVFTVLFGSKEKARLMRFFLFNEKIWICVKELSDKTKLPSHDVQKILRLLMKIDMVRTRTKKQKKYYSLNKSFPYNNQLYRLFSASNTLDRCKSLSRIRRSSAVKFAAVSGMFTENPKAHIDLLIVVSDAKRARIEQSIGYIEAEVGKEIRYALLDVEEFRYRIEMMDRFLKDFFEAGYDELTNKIPHLARSIQSIQDR